MIKQKSKENEIKILKEKTIELEEKLHFLLAEKKKQDLELTFQNEEKDKRAVELILANKELVFQTGEKADRAAELLIANKELAYQNKEKDKRAAELVIANKELAFQNAEKEKRAAELLIANEELVVQSIKKEKMIAEIVSLKDAQLFVEKQLFEKTLISIGDGVISTDEHKNVLFMNRIAEILTGWSKEEAVGKPIYSVFNIISEYNRRNDDDIIEKVIKSKTIRNLANHTILITKDGQEHLIEDSAAPILNKHNKVIGVVVVFRDFSEKWERLKQIEYLNFHDDLTGLYNRRFFEEELMRLDVPRNLPLSIISLT
jgi:PAS domain S-box-containing protein